MTTDLDKRYFLCPLSEVEMARLQHAVGKRIPPGIRAFLARAGYPQSFVPAIFQDEAAFAAGQEYVPHEFFAFAEPGESIFAEGPDGSILEVDPDGELILHSTFDTFVEESKAEPSDVNDLCWTVQLSFSTPDEARVRESLEGHLGARFASAWEHVSVSPAGVSSFVAAADSLGDPPLKRLDYVGWASSIYFLDQKVGPTGVVAFKSYIRHWEASDLGFKLINYGVLPRVFPGTEL